MQDYHKLKVWKKAHRLVLKVYQATKSFPDDERYGITSQLRRAASSIPTNLAEGAGRGSQKEMAQFAQIAAGSASEVEYLIQLSTELGYLEEQSAGSLSENVQEIRKMLSALISTLRKGH